LTPRVALHVEVVENPKRFREPIHTHTAEREELIEDRSHQRLLSHLTSTHGLSVWKPVLLGKVVFTWARYPVHMGCLVHICTWPILAIQGASDGSCNIYTLAPHLSLPCEFIF
jgi:hypothetical protein